MRPTSFFRALILLGLMFGLQRATAAPVNWGSTRLATNYTSDLRPLGQDAGFVFEVGAFAAGFVPTEQNVDQWATHWVSAGEANYNQDFAFVTGSVLLNSGIETGSKGYIWGFDSREAGEVEWILVTDASWVWGASDGVEQPVDWTVGSAGQSVVGIIGDANSPFHMQTAALSVVNLADPEAWLAENFAGQTGGMAAAWDADPDGDGIRNALEFAFGTSPHDISAAVRASVVPVQTAAGPVVSVVFEGLPVEGAPIVLEVSNDLHTWSPAGESVEVRSEGGQWVVEDTVPIAVQQRFFRVTVQL